MFQLQSGDTVAFVANSNPQNRPEEIQKLEKCLQSLGLKVKKSPLLFENSFTNGAEKARVMHQFFQDREIKAIFDISGGDRANGVLPYLDFQLLKAHPTPFFGYSDVSSVLNSLLAHTEQTAELFQLKTLIWDESGGQVEKFKQTFFEGKNSLYQSDWQFIQGNELEGRVIGGNIRCFLKLAGTPYQPDFTDKILFLESYGGDKNALFSSFHQLKQQPHFDKLKGILLGTFISYQEENSYPIAELLKDVLQMPDLPIAITQQIGHRPTSNALSLGSKITLNVK